MEAVEGQLAHPLSGMKPDVEVSAVQAWGGGLLRHVKEAGVPTEMVPGL